jgi:hypothetical protein
LVPRGRAARNGSVPMIETIGIIEQAVPRYSFSAKMKRLHLFMAAACGLLFSICVAGSLPGGADWDWKVLVPAVAVLFPVSFLPGILWHDAGQQQKRDAALTLPWMVLLVALIPWAAVLSGRLGMPLRDGLFASMDGHLGFSIPTIVGWMSAHAQIGAILDHSYPLLFLLLPVAAVLPAAMGLSPAAERFLVANTIAFLAAFPVFASLPAIGPWAGYQLAGTAEQRACEMAIATIRSGHPATGAGIVCFPSFHVVWAVLSAAALWPIKPLRIPASILACLVVISTVTTGWHYVVDSLAGLVLAAIALICADRFLGSQ